MPWPLSQDYNEAIQSPAQCFADAELRQGEVETNALGLPAPRTGNFADVYAVVTGPRKWAIKCFTRQIPGLQERYQQISLHLSQVKLPFMVDFTFLEKGIRVGGKWYPILKMQWVEGFTLNQFIKANLDKPLVLDVLCQLWVKLAGRLREANIAHCDLQHGNVLLVPGSKARALQVKLVDYDGMCVPALTMLKSIEVGHPAYQHPQRQREGIYSLEVDRFSHLVIYTALRGLIAGGKALWDRHDDGDNLLFKPSDYGAPTKSRLCFEIAQSGGEDGRKLVQALIKSLAVPFDQVPLLESIVPQGPVQGIQQRRPSASPKPAQAAQPADAFANLGESPAAFSSRTPRSKPTKKPALVWGLSIAGGLCLILGVLILALRGKHEPEAPAVAAAEKPRNGGSSNNIAAREKPRPMTLSEPQTSSAAKPVPSPAPKPAPEPPQKPELDREADQAPLDPTPLPPQPEQNSPIEPMPTPMPDFAAGATWVGQMKFWSFNKGEIAGSTYPNGLTNLGTYLCTKHKYRDFELRFQVKLTGQLPNSGVFILPVR
jgi:hypothetical protein